MSYSWEQLDTLEFSDYIIRYNRISSSLHVLFCSDNLNETLRVCPERSALGVGAVLWELASLGYSIRIVFSLKSIYYIVVPLEEMA